MGRCSKRLVRINVPIQTFFWIHHGTYRFGETEGKNHRSPYTLGDLNGLSLAVSAQGGKSWHFRYYWQAKQKRVSLRTYPEVSLREARHLREQTRALISKGIRSRDRVPY